MIETVRPFTLAINDGRTPEKVLDFLEDELREAREELSGEGDGNDGPVGEGIDILACVLDYLILLKPDITEEYVNDYLQKKCEKWQRKHREGAYGDRSDTNAPPV